MINITLEDICKDLNNMPTDIRCKLVKQLILGNFTRKSHFLSWVFVRFVAFIADKEIDKLILEKYQYLIIEDIKNSIHNKQLSPELLYILLCEMAELGWTPSIID